MTQKLRDKQRRIDLEANRIVTAHVESNVTGLVSSLCDYDDADAMELMRGRGDKTYDAYEIWCVSDWLAARLEEHDHRVLQWWGSHYWARGATGQAIYMDTVIKDIAKKELAS